LNSLNLKLISILLISCLGLIVYSNTFHNSFHYDDVRSITDNLSIRSFHNLLSIWEFYPCRFITFLSFTLNYHFNGLNVLGYHLFNLGVHLISAILVWWLTLLTFYTPAMKTEKINDNVNLIALFAGLLFVSHPLQTEAVTYIWQRTASMGVMFYLASLCLYVKSTLLRTSKPSPNIWKFYYLLSLLTAVLAFFTKEMTITLPLMILLYEFYFFRTQKNFHWKFLIPFLLSLLIMPLTLLFLPHAVRNQEMEGVLTGMSTISPLHYFLTQIKVIVTYIRLSFLPFNQNLDYDYPISKSFFEWPVFCSFLFLSLILYFATRLFSKYRLVSFSIFWFFLTLIPESSVIPLKDVIFEHRLYLPLVGFCICVVSTLYYLLEKRKILPTVVIGLMLIVGCNSYLTYQRNFVWKDEFTLWDDTAKKSPHKARALNNLGVANIKRSEFTQAIYNFTKAIKIDPSYAEAFYNLGTGYYHQSNFTQAEVYFNKTLKLDPSYAKAYNNRGLIHYEQGEITAAIKDFTKAIELLPSYTKAYNNRGIALLKEGSASQALSDFNKAIETDPDDAEGYYNRGTGYYYQKKFALAIPDFNKAIEINPDYAEAYFNRANAFNNQGEFTQAILDYNNAITLNPGNAVGYNNRGNAYNAQGNFSKALIDYNKAIELNPNYAKAYYNRAVNNYYLKDYDHAWVDVKKASELGVAVNPVLVKALQSILQQSL